MPDKLAAGRTAPQEETTDARDPVVKRPLVPLVFALMLGLAAAAWGVHIPKVWLIAVLAGLLVVMLLLFLGAPSGSRQKSVADSKKATIESHPESDDPDDTI